MAQSTGKEKPSKEEQQALEARLLFEENRKPSGYPTPKSFEKLRREIERDMRQIRVRKGKNKQ